MPARKNEKSKIEIKVDTSEIKDPLILCDRSQCPQKGEIPRCYLDSFKNCQMYGLRIVRRYDSNNRFLY